MRNAWSVGRAGLDESVPAPGRLTTVTVDGTVRPCVCTGALMAHAGFGLPAQPATDRRSSGAPTPGPRSTQPAATDQHDPQPKPPDPSPQPHPPPLTPGRLIEGAGLAPAREVPCSTPDPHLVIPKPLWSARSARALSECAEATKSTPGGRTRHRNDSSRRSLNPYPHLLPTEVR
jgi:hypothetical protein